MAAVVESVVAVVAVPAVQILLLFQSDLQLCSPLFDW